ncbi:hypothetical protein ACFL3V_04395 [Nanoarchaeota archaeon]
MTADIFDLYRKKMQNGDEPSSTGNMSERGSLLFYCKALEQRDVSTATTKLEAIRDIAQYLITNKVSKTTLSNLNFPLLGDQRLQPDVVELLEKIGYTHATRDNEYYLEAQTGIFTRPKVIERDGADLPGVEILFEDISEVKKPGPYYLYYMRTLEDDLEAVIDDFQMVVPGVNPAEKLVEMTRAAQQKGKGLGARVKGLFGRRKKDVVDDESETLTPIDEAQVRLYMCGFYEGPNAIRKAFVRPEDDQAESKK